MKILFYRYNSIYEPDCILAFQEFGLEVVTETAQMDGRIKKPSDAIPLLAKTIVDQMDKGDPYLFVFSINFFPAISDICQKLNVTYACWSVDCPVVELFFNQIKNPCNRIFLFDRVQYERIVMHNPQCIFYLPLGTNTDRMDKVIATITPEEKAKYSADISFVGSLYNDKNPLRKMKLTDYAQGFIDSIINAQLQVYGCNFIEDSLTDQVVSELKGETMELQPDSLVEPLDRYVAANKYIGFAIADRERHDTLNMLAKDFKVDLYTESPSDELHNVNVRGGANSLYEMPKIFHLSKINLNMTMRPIQTGLPLRIFDVMGSGGFLMTNFQSEIPEMFEIGKDLEVYTSLDELREKCEYYLTHEDERLAIANNGYIKTKQYHNCKQRIQQMIACMLGE